MTGIDDLDFAALELDRPEAVDVDVRRIDDLVSLDGLGANEDRVGDIFRRRPPCADIVFDAEIAMRTAGIVAGREDDPPERAKRANQSRNGRRREDSALADHDAAEAVGGGDFHHDLDRLAIEEAAVAAQDKRLAFKALQRVEDRLNVVFEIAGLLKHRNLLAQARGARFLVGERFRGDGSDHDGVLLRETSIGSSTARRGRACTKAVFDQTGAPSSLRAKRKTP